MKKQTVRLILDCMICDAMSPEFKKANDILLRIIKTNDRTDGLPHTRLAELNRAFKANDPKAAKVAYDKLAALVAKGEKDLQDGLNEAKSKLAETTRTFETAKAALAQQKPMAALFDKFVKAIDAAKANPKGVSKLNAYADKLKAFGDFSKRIMQIQQMATAKKDISKQCDMLKKAVDTGKAKHAKAMKKAEDDLAKAKDRVAVFKEMDKIRAKKIAEFAKEREDVQKLGAALPKDTGKASTGKPQNETVEQKKERALKYINSTVAPALAELRREEDAYINGLVDVIGKATSERRSAGKEASDALRACAGEMPVDSVSRKFYVVAKNVSNGNLTDDTRSLFMKAKTEAVAYKDMDNWETIKSVFNRAAAAIRNMQSRVESTYNPPAPYEKRQVLTYVGGDNDADKYERYERDTIEKLFGAKRNKLRELARKVSEIIPIKISEHNLRLVSEKIIGKDIAEYLRKEVEKYREKPDALENGEWFPV